MRHIMRQFRRAPGRIVASILALALAVGAVGVLAIPTVSEGSLHQAVTRDGLADITMRTSPVDDQRAARVAAVAGVAALDREVDVGRTLANGTAVRVIGLELRDQQLDLLQLRAGRLPVAPAEVVVSDGVAPIGETVTVEGARGTNVALTVVGTGTTLWWSDVRAIFGDVDDLVGRLGLDGANRIVVGATRDDIDSLRTITHAARDELAAVGVTMTDFPVYLPDGTTPIDEDIRQVSTLIGLLGAVAGIVALVLLGSTANTLITERSREVAVMRALGGRTRALRRRLRRIAVAITAVALVIGLPLGVLISNLIARMVLEKFVGITPDFAISWPVVLASAAAALVGARIVAARAARHVTAAPLAEALRDREGTPFGRRPSDRLVARLALGGLRSRMALRASVHRRARALSVVAQIAAGVGALVVITSLATSVNAYNDAAQAPWSWQSRAIARDPGLPFSSSIADADPHTEAGAYVIGEVDDREVEVFGLRPDTTMFDPMLRAGRWIEPARREAVVSDGFAARRGLVVGNTVDVELATGRVRYVVVGTSHDGNRAIYVDRADVAADLGRPGAANVVWSTADVAALDLPVAVEVATAATIAQDDAAGRAAIVVIFGTIAAIVAGVAALAVISTMAVNLYERRHEVATLQALGASRRRLRGLIARELLPLGAVGVGIGVLAGWYGAQGIIASFEASNEVTIGTVFAVGAVPAIVLGTAAALLTLAAVAVRSAGRRPIAVVLRGAV